MSPRLLAVSRLFPISVALVVVMNLCFISGAFGQIAEVTGSPQTSTTTGTTLTITKPSGLAVGDLMIANIMQINDVSGTLSNASRSGWTLIDGRSIASSGSLRAWGTLLYRVAVASDVSATNFAFTLDGDSDGSAGAIMAFSNVDVTGGVTATGAAGGPFDVDPGTINVASSSTVTATGITTSSDNAAVIMFGMVSDNVSFNNNWSTTSPGALNESYDQNVNGSGNADCGVGAAWEIKTSAGSTGNGTVTLSGGTDFNGGLLVALKSAPIPPTVSGFSPTSACAESGVSVTINGANFTGATDVSFNGQSASFTVNTSTQITATLPSGATTGTISVTTPAGTGTSGSNFVVNQPPAATGATICQGGSGELTSSTTCPTNPATSSGPNHAGNGNNVSGIGTITWSNPGNITADDVSYATIFMTNNGEVSNYLQGTGYGFSIPANATITGIVATIGRFENSSSGTSIRDLVVSLIKNGTVISQNKAITGTDWPTGSVSAQSYGSSSDVWGETWTPADINASNFGLALAVNTGTDSDRTGSVDYIQITVYYTLPGTLDWYTAASGGTFLGSGTPFNPVGVVGSGLPNTNTPGTYTYYVECSTVPGCRASADFEITEAATADAGGTYEGCGTNPVSIEATASGTGSWSGGLGTFGSASSATTTYTPHASEVGGMVVLTWTTDDPDGAGPCTSASDNATVHIGTPATADAGGPYNTCGATPVAVSATTSGTGMWSGGAGSFASPTSANTTYTPAAADFGNTITLTWTTDDPDGVGGCMSVSDNASLTVSGQEINVRGNGVDIANGDATPASSDYTDFGWTTVSAGTIVRTFSIKNSGSSALTLNGGTPVTIGGANAGDFTVTMQPSSPVASGGAMTMFQITFDPSAAGMRTATVSIDNDDCDEAPFTFDIQGKGTIPQAISVFGNGNQITNRASTASVSDDTDFGSASTGGGMVSHTFTIKNIDNGSPLHLNGVPHITIADRDASDFSVTSTPSSPIDGGGDTTFTVKFQPTATGLRTAIVIITHDDLPENAFVFTINGTGL